MRNVIFGPPLGAYAFLNKYRINPNGISYVLTPRFRCVFALGVTKGPSLGSPLNAF